jgi:hypothetical protein
VSVSEKTNHKTQEMIGIPEMIEVQDIPEIEAHVHAETILDLKHQQRSNH